MKKRLIAIFLTLCLALSLAACSSGGSSASPQTQEPSTAESDNAEAESSEPSEDILAKMTDEQREKYEEYLESKKQDEENKASNEANEYGITDAELQSLVEAIKENVTNDYLNVYDINTSDFSWPGAETEFWQHTAAVVSFAVRVSQFFNLPDSVFEGMSEEETVMAKALLSGINDWQDNGDGKFLQVFDTLPDESSLIQFFLDNVTFE